MKSPVEAAQCPVSAARIELVAVEEEEHDPRAAHLLEERVEARRVVAPGIVELEEAAVGRGRGRDDREDVVGGVGGHEREEGAEALPGEHHLPVAAILEVADVADERAGAVLERVAVPHPVESERVPAGVLEARHVVGGRRERVLGMDRAAVAPDHRALRGRGAEQRRFRIGGIEAGDQRRRRRGERDQRRGNDRGEARPEPGLEHP